MRYDEPSLSLPKSHPAAWRGKAGKDNREIPTIESRRCDQPLNREARASTGCFTGFRNTKLRTEDHKYAHTPLPPVPLTTSYVRAIFTLNRLFLPDVISKAPNQVFIPIHHPTKRYLHKFYVSQDCCETEKPKTHDRN